MHGKHAEFTPLVELRCYSFLIFSPAFEGFPLSFLTLYLNLSVVVYVCLVSLLSVSCPSRYSIQSAVRAGTQYLVWFLGVRKGINEKQLQNGILT